MSIVSRIGFAALLGLVLSGPARAATLLVDDFEEEDGYNRLGGEVKTYARGNAAAVGAFFTGRRARSAMPS